MLADDELEAYFEKHALTDSAMEYILYARTSDPSRSAGQGGGANLVSRYPSLKMGRTIQTESRTVENLYAIELEYSPLVLEFWDQPPPVPVNRTDRTGKSRPGSYTADFLVLTVDGPTIDELKPAAKIATFLQSRPDDWGLEDSVPVFRPAREAYAALGLTHRVVSSADINQIRVTNLALLLQSRNIPDDAMHQLRPHVERVLTQRACVRFADLAAEFQVEDLTPLLQLIDRGIIHASLSNKLLAQPSTVWVAASAAMLALHEEIESNELALTAPGDSNPIKISEVPSATQAARALAILDRIDQGQRSRSLRGHAKKIKEAEINGESRFRAVLPKYHDRGNRTPRLHPLCVETLNRFFDEEFAKPTRTSERRSYKIYIDFGKQAHPHLPAVSWPTFRKYLRLANQRKIGKGRGGLRAANAATPPVDVESRLLTATRSFERGSMDHHECDIHCVIARRGDVVYKARPYLSVLIDCYTKMILALWVSFRAPSSRVCALLMRLCVRRHGRVPEEVIVDWGPDLRSIFFQALIAECRSQHTLRPKSHPRYGSEAERFFGIFKTAWLSMRPGNFANYYEARSVSGTHSAHHVAALTVEEFLAELLAFAEWYNANKVGVDTPSPVELHNEGLRRFPCSGKRVTYDERFIIASAVDVKRYTVDPTRGIHVGELHYWHPMLSRVAAQKTRLTDVKAEPEDPYRVYALVDQQWVTALASGAQQFHTLDPVAQHAKAIRILDGATARTQAKDDADQILIRKMREFENDRLVAAASEQTTKSADVRAAPDDQKSIFSELRSTNVVPLNKTKWRS